MDILMHVIHVYVFSTHTVQKKNKTIFPLIFILFKDSSIYDKTTFTSHEHLRNYFNTTSFLSTEIRFNLKSAAAEL